MKWKIVLLVVLILAVISVSVFLIKKPAPKPEPIFDGYLRVSVNRAYSETCFPSGEVMDVIPENQCCNNTQEVGIIDESQPGCNFIAGVVFCSDCGNKKCDYGENNCNCPLDCD